jgi:hypothetical protein
VSFGVEDPLNRAVASAADWAFGGNASTQFQNVLQQQQQQFQAQHPLVSGGAAVAGSIPTYMLGEAGLRAAVPVLQATGATPTVGNLLRSAASNAAVSGVQGAGMADGSLADRVQAGMRGAGVGAVAGPVADVVGQVAGKVLGAGADTASANARQVVADAKQTASDYYNIANQSGSTLTPQFTDNFVNSVGAAAPQTTAGQVVAGDNAVTQLAKRLEALRGQPMTLQAAQEVDEGIGDLIDREFDPIKGLSKDGRQLAGIQRSFRDQIANAGPGDITGGPAGFDALAQGRQAWAQAMKMDDLLRIQDRAQMTANPATSFQTQIRSLLTSATKSRGYTDAERAALEAAATRGTLGDTLQTFGSRLLPIVAAGAGASSGPLAGVAAPLAAHVGATALRRAATNVAQSRVTSALGTLAQGVPPNPLTGVTAAFPAAVPQTRLLPAFAAAISPLLRQWQQDQLPPGQQ